MNVIKAILLLLIGFILLVKASDIFVTAVSSIATNLKMSKMMIALTVAAFGTCAPELAISFQSMASHSGDIALANVFGSNIVNILLIIGLAACVAPIRVKNHVIKRELPLLLITTITFSICIGFHYLGLLDRNQILSRQDGLLLITLFAMFIFYIVSVVKAKQGVLEFEKPEYSMIKSIIYTIVCCVVIIYSSDIVVDNAKNLAELLNINTKIITMTVVVIGTSLPEMTMTIIAAKRGEFDFAIGNIIGTNIFNIGVVLGLPLLVYGGIESDNFNMIDVSAVLISSIVLFIFARSDKKLSTLEGALMISLFVIYYAYVLAT